MKKLMFFLIMAISLNSLNAANVKDVEKNYINYECNRLYSYGNISPEDLPKPITKYLKEKYPNYTILVCKRQNNGNYFVKIRFGGNNYHSYYRSLVFDSQGKVIKG